MCSCVLQDNAAKQRLSRYFATQRSHTELPAARAGSEPDGCVSRSIAHSLVCCPNLPCARYSLYTARTQNTHAYTGHFTRTETETQSMREFPAPTRPRLWIRRKENGRRCVLKISASVYTRDTPLSQESSAHRPAGSYIHRARAHFVHAHASSMRRHTH